MKSDFASMQKRGYIDSNIESGYLQTDFNQKVRLLYSDIPFEKSLGARLLAIENNSGVVELLIRALERERKLYSKIEICNALAKQGKSAVKPLILLLGKIGKSQHLEVPQTPFNKKSYPLPRDIVARTLSYMGLEALPDLLSNLDTQSKQQLSESIDSIGYICFYDYNNKVYTKLIQCYSENENKELIRWKIIRAMSGLPESRSFLTECLETENNYGIKLEIKRSLELILANNTYNFFYGR